MTKNVIQTASDAKRHYDALPTQYIRLNDKLYCYNYTKLKFVQIMLCEEKANLKKIRLDAFSENLNVADSDMDLDYIAELVSMLFVPAPDKKPLIFSRDKMKETKKDFEASDNPVEYEKVIRCLRDFFTLRGKRAIVSATLTMLGSSDRMITRMMAQAASIYSKSPLNTKGSTIPANTTGASKSGSETQPSGS